MSRFLQLHLLTSYPPSNLNRDDLGRPKTAVMGGANRLRVSSQSLKRAWRTSDVFETALAGHLGTRTKEMGRIAADRLIEQGVAEKSAREWARAIAAKFGKLKKTKDDGTSDSLEIEQLAHFSPEEKAAVLALCDNLAERGEEPGKDELELLHKDISAADIALFGRMLAASPAFNMEAAAQVAHAVTVHKVAVEDDFFTAVDDLNQEDAGAGHMGETEFGAGLYYLYLCIDRCMLTHNLGGDAELAGKAIAALTEAAATVSPTGKQNSFASRARASYIYCETGDQQPRSLSVAFLQPIRGTNMLTDAVAALHNTRDAMDKAYGACSDVAQRVELNLLDGTGTLNEVITCAIRDLAPCD